LVKKSKGGHQLFRLKLETFYDEIARMILLPDITLLYRVTKNFEKFIKIWAVAELVSVTALGLG